MPVAPTIFHGTLPLILKGPVRRRGDRGTLDAASYEILCAPDQIEEQLQDLGLIENEPVDDPRFHALFVMPWEEEDESDMATLVKISCIGLFKDTDKRKREISTQSKDISLGPQEGKTYSTPAGSARAWAIKDADLVYTDTYFTTTKPDTTVIGRAFTVGADAPNPPEYLGWFGIPLRYQYPSGWVLQDRKYNLVAGKEQEGKLALYEVVDTVAYYQTAQPDS